MCIMIYFTYLLARMQHYKAIISFKDIILKMIGVHFSLLSFYRLRNNKGKSKGAALWNYQKPHATPHSRGCVVELIHSY